MQLELLRIGGVRGQPGGDVLGVVGIELTLNDCFRRTHGHQHSVALCRLTFALSGAPLFGASALERVVRPRSQRTVLRIWCSH